MWTTHGSRVWATLGGVVVAAVVSYVAYRRWKNRFRAIADQYRTLEEVQEALKRAGLRESNLIIGIDYGASNMTQGAKTFEGHSLHAILDDRPNPYQLSIFIIAKTLEAFDEDKLVPVFGFGDLSTDDYGLFPFFPDRPCRGFEEVLHRYNEVTPTLTLSGGSNFAPVIRAAISIVRKRHSYHILLLLSDGNLTDVGVEESARALVEASKYPLSVIAVGLGDGPFDVMRRFDDCLPERDFDNFQFVPLAETMAGKKFPDIAFAVNALQEIPDQYKHLRRTGLV